MRRRDSKLDASDEPNMDLVRRPPQLNLVRFAVPNPARSPQLRPPTRVVSDGRSSRQVVCDGISSLQGAIISGGSVNAIDHGGSVH